MSNNNNKSKKSPMEIIDREHERAMIQYQKKLNKLKAIDAAAFVQMGLYNDCKMLEAELRKVKYVNDLIHEAIIEIGVKDEVDAIIDKKIQELKDAKAVKVDKEQVSNIIV